MSLSPSLFRLVPMKKSKVFWRSLSFVLLIAAVCGGLVAPVIQPVRAAPMAQASTSIVISEFRTRGSGGENDEFIELFNLTTSSLININGWTIRKSSGCGTGNELLATIPLTPSLNLNPGQHYLVSAFSYSGTVAPDYRHGSNWAIDDDGGIAIFDSSSTLVDQVGMCDTTTYFEPTNLSPLTNNVDQGYERIPDGSGNCTDTNDNLADFFLRDSGPQNLLSLLTTCGNPTPTPTSTLTPSLTPTNTLTPTLTVTPTRTSTPTVTLTSPPVALSVVISELRTTGPNGGNDEFIELFNPTSGPILIGDWTLRRSAGCGSSSTFLMTTITSGMVLAPGQHYLIGGASYSGTVTPNQSFPSSQGIADNGGVALLNGTTFMDRVGMCASTTYYETSPLSPLSTQTNRSYDRKANSSGLCIDSNNNLADFFVRTPSDPQNLASPLTLCGNPTPPPTATPKGTATKTPIPPPPPPLIAINEFLPRPGRDWNNDGFVNTGDEFIEIINHGTISVNLSGYTLDDEANVGSKPFALPSITLAPGERIVFYGSKTGLLLSDGGDGVRLLKPNGSLMDAYNYSLARYPDQSFCRLPDNGGLDDWNRNCFPTPGLKNSSGGAPGVGSSADTSFCPVADTLPLDFYIAECAPFGNNIWSRPYWDDTGWFGEQPLPNYPGKWEIFLD